MDTLGFAYIFPIAGRIGDSHPLERVPIEHTKNQKPFVIKQKVFDRIKFQIPYKL